MCNTKMNNKDKTAIVLFSLYKLIIVISIFVQFFEIDSGILNAVFKVVNITILVVSYWYFLINVLNRDDRIFDKIRLFDKTILLCDLIVKLIEYYLVYYVNGIGIKLPIVFICIGVLLFDIILECRIYCFILRVRKKDFRVIYPKDNKCIYYKRDLNHLFWMYILSAMNILVIFIQIIRVIMEGDVHTEFIIRYAIVICLLNTHVRTSIKYKKIYIKCINYIINLVLLIIESGLYWITVNEQSALYVKVMVTFIALLCFECLITGLYGKRYNEARRWLENIEE